MRAKTIITVLLSGLFVIAAFFRVFSRKRFKVITLTVDTDKINDNNIEETTNFGQSRNIPNKEFTTEVRPGDKIKWKIKKLKGSNRKAKLVKFQHVDGVKFFMTESISARDWEINGTIKNGAWKTGAHEKYTLEIEVKNRENKWKTYPVDPKLKLIQGGNVR